MAGRDGAIGERIFERRQLVAHRGTIGGGLGFFAGAAAAAAQTSAGEASTPGLALAATRRATATSTASTHPRTRALNSTMWPSSSGADAVGSSSNSASTVVRIPFSNICLSYIRSIGCQPDSEKSEKSRSIDVHSRIEMASGCAGFAVMTSARDDRCTTWRVAAIEIERARTIDQIANLERSFAGIVDAAELTSTDDEHDPEGATIAYERAQVSALLRQARDDLVALDGALDRIDDGSIQSCAVCGNPIALRALCSRCRVRRTCVRCAT